jgi:hypothetical protein
MSVFGFISSLAWPITVLLIILIFRSSLLKLIANVKTVKYKGLEVEVGDTLQVVTPMGGNESPLQQKPPVEDKDQPKIQKLSDAEIEQSRQRALKRLQEDTERNGEQRGELFQLANGRWAIAWRAEAKVTIVIKTS